MTGQPTYLRQTVCINKFYIDTEIIIKLENSPPQRQECKIAFTLTEQMHYKFFWKRKVLCRGFQLSYILHYLMGELNHLIALNVLLQAATH